MVRPERGRSAGGELAERRRWAGAILPIAAAWLLAAAPGHAQTDDAIFGLWRMAPDELGSRPMGMAGAFVAVADEVKASLTNPAGLTQIPITELNLSSGRAWAGAAGGRRNFRLAAYATRLDTRRAGSERGSLETSGWEAGLALAVQPLSRVSLGATLAWSTLRLEGESGGAGSAAGAAGVRFGGEDQRSRVSAGALVDLLGGGPRSLAYLRLGLAYHPGYDWSLNRTPSDAQPSTAGRFVLRRPTVVSAGLAGRSSERWGFSLQGDLIRYREVLESLKRNLGGEPAASGFQLPDSIEPRFGLEYVASLRCGCGLVRGRAGLHYQASGALRYTGADPARAAAFRGAGRSTALSLGASFQTEHFDRALRLDVDSRDVFDERELSFGIVWRF